MRIRRCLPHRVLETGSRKIRSETGLPLLCYPSLDPFTSPLKQAAGDPRAKTCASRRVAESSTPPVSNPLTRCAISHPTLHDATSSPETRGAGKKRPSPVDDCDGNSDHSATASITRPRKKRRLAAPASRKVKVKSLPLREELEVLREALPPVIRSHLDPPRDDKGPIPNERRTFGEFLRWKSLYDDEMVSRITDERHVVCKRCGDSFALCHDTAYNWYKWGRHREWCIDHTAPDSDRAEAMKPPTSPVLLHNELLRRTGRPEVDALFPKTKGGPYYQHSWTYFVPRPGQSRPDDPPEAPAPSSSICLSETRLAARSPSPTRKRSIESVTRPSRPRVPTQLEESQRLSFPRTYRRCPWCFDHNFKAEEEAEWFDGNIPNGVELLLAAAKFVESTHVQCTQNMHSVHFLPI